MKPSSTLDYFAGELCLACLIQSTFVISEKVLQREMPCSNMLALVSLFVGSPRSQEGLCLVIIAPKFHCWQHSFLGLPSVQHLKEISSGWLQLFYSNSGLPRHMHTRAIDGDLCISADGDLLVKVQVFQNNTKKLSYFLSFGFGASIYACSLSYAVLRPTSHVCALSALIHRYFCFLYQCNKCMKQPNNTCSIQRHFEDPIVYILAIASTYDTGPRLRLAIVSKTVFYQIKLLFASFVSSRKGSIVSQVYVPM